MVGFFSCCSDHEGDVMSVSILSGVDPNLFISGSCDMLAKVWDIRTGKCTMTLRGHESDINSTCLFPDGRAFGTGSDDSTCRYLNILPFLLDNIFINYTSLCPFMNQNL